MSATRCRIIGLGQAAAGDDGVGFAVVDELRRRGVPSGVEVLRAPDATALLALLETPAEVVLVDAAEGARPGTIVELGADGLAGAGVRCLSSHGLRVSEVLALARELSPDRMSPSVHIVAITIARPDRLRHGLSPAVAAAVPQAADRVLARLGGAPCTRHPWPDRSSTSP